MNNSNKYTNTVRAAAYSLGVDVELLQQALEPLRKASDEKSRIAKAENADTAFLITLNLKKK